MEGTIEIWGNSSLTTGMSDTKARRDKQVSQTQTVRPRASTATRPLVTIPPSPIVQLQPPNLRESTSSWDLLPPFEKLLEGSQILTTSFFQLRFLPKTLFFERLERTSVGQRIPPPEHLEATALVPEQMYTPSLEATQGLFLMSIAEWGKGDKHRNSMHMGIAVTMAGILRLHREETYQLPTLLPCNKAEFAFGSIAGPRAAMARTVPALANPDLVHCPSRSLFATLLQTHSLLGRVARIAGRDDEHTSQNWQVRRDEYMEISAALNEFEANIPPLHRWSTLNLRGFKAEGLELAYFFAVIYVCHIVVEIPA
ncbi:fungal specific transcription factor domain-containing protein [Aspergillus mulundensis]|uniref:Transcription factor domain-containing protein n=1 Tax=Aspergillus mulundensis TaxID=1810919 RepID=A0A3D8QW58_9EURO|nr:hypothetical protein DSM5745_09649 [Aspergillus mulundensis]RDW65910.1 hypothetical protein DSM5745_09649 [Aspergillus mulundensis]